MSEYIYEIHAWKGKEKVVTDILEDELSAEARLLSLRETYPNYFWNIHRVTLAVEELDREDDGA